MIRRFLPLVCLLAALVSCGRASDQAKPEGPYPALWEIADENGRLEGWLFGTIHALPDGSVWRSPRLDQALQRADMLVVEVADLNDTERLGEIFKRLAFDSPTGPLASRIDRAHAAELDMLIVEARVRRDYFDPMESWAAALALAQIAQTSKTENGADRVLIEAFGDREIVELEGAEKQLTMFDSLPEKEQRDLLNAVLEETRDTDKGNDALARAWLAGDTDQLVTLTRKGILADPELAQALLARRNADWVARIENLLSAGETPLIAVGSGHLLGKDGLPALLEARGYRVRRVE